MVDEALKILILNSPAGAAIVILLLVVKNLYAQITELQEKRIAEMSKNTLVIEQNKIVLDTAIKIFQAKIYNGKPP